MEAAQEQARVAREALVAADRPWIKVIGLSEPRLDIKTDNVFFNARLDVKNIGRSPAPRTSVRTKLLPDAIPKDEAGEAETLCREAVARRIPWREISVFPDDGRSVAIDADANMESIAEDRRTMVERDFERLRQGLDDESALERRALLLSFPLRAAFTLVGCVAYEIPTGRAHGQTAFIYRVSRECGAGPSVYCSFEMSEPMVHKGEALSIRENWTSAFAR